MTRTMAAAILVAAVSWAVMDKLQSSALDRIYETEYTARLHDQAAQDRKRFDAAIHDLHHATVTIANLYPVIQYVRDRRTREGDWTDPNTQVPTPTPQARAPWMPSRSFLREHFVPNNILLLDPMNRVREVISPTHAALPELFSKPLALLAAKSYEQALITDIDGIPYIVATGRLDNENGEHIASLLSLTRIDTRLLRNTQKGYLDPDSILALSSGESETIIASTDNTQLPVGEGFASHADQFLITGKEFFDYGSSEIHINFLTLIPRARFEELLTPVLEVNRQHRTILALLFTVLLIVFLLYLTKRIRTLREAVTYFTTKVYGTSPPPDINKGDELDSTQVHFTHLTEEILKSREKLEAETRHRIAAVQRQSEIESEVQRLHLMSSVTEALQVGVLEKRDGTYVPRTKTMETFIDKCGGTEPFTSATPGEDLVIDCACDEDCIFTVDIPKGLDTDLILVRDVTKRRNAERQIESLALFPAQNPNPVIRAAADGTVLLANRASDTLFAHWGINDNALPENIRVTVQQALDKGAPLEQEIDLDARTFVLTYSPVPSDQHVNIYANDITARKQAETDLRLALDEMEDRVEERTKALSAEIEVRCQNETELRKLNRAVEQTAHMIFITDVEGVIEYINPKFTEWLGYTPEEAIGQTPRLIKSGDTPNEVYKELWSTILSGQEWRGEIKDRRKNGDIFWASAAIAPVRDDDGNITHFIAVHEDITQRKEAETAMVAARRAAESANKAKTDMLANMSHELRTPLNAIIGFSETMRHGVFGALNNEHYEEYVDFIHSSGSHLLQLINDILDVSAAEAGKLTLHESDVDISEVCEAAMRIVQSQANKSQVALKPIEKNGLPSLHCDPLRLKQIFINLMSNALKFTPPQGSVTCDAYVDDNNEMVLTISDTGIGMDELGLEKALAKFEQVDSSLSRKYEGTGLGLPLTKGLVEIHGGIFELDSAPDQGTTVTIRFPAERVRSTTVH